MNEGAPLSAESGRHVAFPKEQSQLSSLVRYRGNPLLRFEDLRRMYPPVVGFRLLGRGIIIVHDHTAIEDILVKQHQLFTKDSYTQELSEVLGRGLLTSEGEEHRRQRKLIAPSFAPLEVTRFAQPMIDRAEAFARSLPPGESLDVGRACMRLTLEILVETIFGHELLDFEEVERELNSVMKAFRPWAELVRGTAPKWLPLPSRLRIRRARVTLRRIASRLVSEKRASGAGDDLLSRLIHARDDDQRLTDEELVDQVLTLLLAGHETTALGVTYALRLLAQHPEHQQRAREEIQQLSAQQVSAGLTAKDLLGAEFTKAVFLETLRLYPPAWLIGRRATQDCRVGEWFLPEGSELFIPLYSLHRNERWFADPEAFKPARFMGASSYPRFAYAPFGGGARICVGQHFAMLEAMAILVGLLKHRHFECEESGTLPLAPSVSLRPARPVVLRACQLP